MSPRAFLRDASAEPHRAHADKTSTGEKAQDDFASEDGWGKLDMTDLMQKAEDHAKASEHVKAREVYAQVLALEPDNPLALEGHRKATTATEMEAAMEAMRAEEEDAAAKAQERLAKEEEEMRKMRAIEDKLQVWQRPAQPLCPPRGPLKSSLPVLQEAHVGTKSPEPEPEPTAQLAEEGVPPGAVALVPVDDPVSDLTEEMARLRQLADAPVTPSPSTFTPGAHMVSPTIAGSPALSGVLANTEGLSAFEQILRLREVRHPPASVSASLHACRALTRLALCRSWRRCARRRGRTQRPRRCSWRSCRRTPPTGFRRRTAEVPAPRPPGETSGV